MAVNPVYSEAFDHFAPAAVRGNEARAGVGDGKAEAGGGRLGPIGAEGARDLLRLAGVAVFYPWPPHNEQRFQEAFEELATRWRPILDTFGEQGWTSALSCIPGRSARRRDLRAFSGAGG